MKDLLAVIIRPIILYFYLLIMVRIMGKRELGQLSPFDFVVAIMIAELASIPMEDTSIPLINGVIPILILVILQIFISYLTMESTSIRRLINGAPSIVIKNGKIQTDELKKARCNINDLLESLRKKDVFEINDVEFAIMEPSGELSVIPKSQKRPITPEDMGLSTQYEGLPIPLILDGKIKYESLQEFDLDKSWLMNEMHKQGIVDVKDVMFASINTKGDLFFAKKEEGCE